MTGPLSPEASRLASRLDQPGIVARPSPFGCGRLALFRQAGTTTLGAGYASSEAARELGEAGLARWREDEGGRYLELAARQNRRELEPVTMEVGGEAATVMVDQRESPLLWLRRRPGRDGQPQISDDQFAAGERFRADLTRAAMLPRTTMNWDAAATPDERGPQARDHGSASDAAVAARQRVRTACDRLGPELSGLAIDVCGFLKGLDQVERERGWPARSGKVVLRVALTQLAQHYGIAVPARTLSRPSAWQAPDARPRVQSPG